MILAGDVGGTKSNLGLFEVADGKLQLVHSAQYRSPDHPGLGSVIEAFLAAGPPVPAGIRAACFGIAGPVVDNRVSTPNLAWVVDGAALARESNVPVVSLINDLVATAEGLPELGDDEVAVLQPGASTSGSEGNRALVAAGTGLGTAFIPRIGDRWVPVPSEGGHVDFAPRIEEEIGLLRYLRERFGRVSVERVLSGPGLFNIYMYLRDVVNLPESPQVRERLASGEDPAKVIGESGLAGPAGGCAVCFRALETFVAVYGAVAGNIALLGTATGGVWLGGGIAPKILPRLSDGLFRETFRAKGRFAAFLERVPVRVILNDRAALLGAARRATELAAG
ncbi:MAG TPA: glucokinase [Thermoanaerobaculia bacterium]|jgi:glucokinase|nr:glucokinase [Thermoanaerobaculia bacterium]